MHDNSRRIRGHDPDRPPTDPRGGLKKNRVVLEKKSGWVVDLRRRSGNMTLAADDYDAATSSENNLQRIGFLKADEIARVHRTLIDFGA